MLQEKYMGHRLQCEVKPYGTNRKFPMWGEGGVACDGWSKANTLSFPQKANTSTFLGLSE